MFTLLNIEYELLPMLFLVRMSNLNNDVDHIIIILAVIYSILLFNISMF